MDARATYEAGRAAARAELGHHDARIRALGLARLGVAFAAVAVLAGVVWGHFPPWAPVVLGGLVAGFAALVVLHARAFAARARSEARARFHDRGVARLDGTWRQLDGGDPLRPPKDHPFAEDLDIFGPSSLFQLLDATETPFGRDALATALASGAIADDSPATRTWEARLGDEQEAVRELAADVEWRERLSVEGALLRSGTTTPRLFLEWAEAQPAPIPSSVVILAYALPLALLVVAARGHALGLPPWSWAVVLAVELLVSTRYRPTTRPTLEAVSEHAGSLARHASLFAAALSKERKATRLTRILEKLRGPSGQGGVVREMARLERVATFADARNNEVFRFFIAPVLMWDLHCAAALEQWRARAGKDVRRWFLSLGQLEAFASLSGFAFDRPDHAWPAARSPVELVARGLGHPLLDASRRVGNDVDLAGPGSALVVTGSNMSGKSTLLRAIGVNVVLANLGAPVTATSFSFGLVSLATSMRIKDSLDEGVSHFYAELQKLKRVVDLAEHPPPVLFLLDEILHGTNSRERIIGARSVVSGLLRRGALGAVSTHDLGIADLGDAAPGVKNVHFEEQVNADGTMTFDYRLRDGRVMSSNALRLMRALGLDVPLDTAGSTPPAP